MCQIVGGKVVLGPNDTVGLRLRSDELKTGQSTAQNMLVDALPQFYWEFEQTTALRLSIYRKLANLNTDSWRRWWVGWIFGGLYWFTACMAVGPACAAQSYSVVRTKETKNTGDT